MIKAGRSVYTFRRLKDDFRKREVEKCLLYDGHAKDRPSKWPVSSLPALKKQCDKLNHAHLPF